MARRRYRRLLPRLRPGRPGAAPEALATLRDARQRLLDLDRADLRMAARATAAIGRVQDHLGDAEEAQRTLADAVRELSAQDATHYAAQARVELADIAERTGGDPGTVREHLTEALAVYEEGGSPLAEELRARLDRMGDAGR
ncbi:hypothetical protein NKH77_06220 [Streptomyces sp. M19]